MEGSCSTGQSPQWAVVPVEEEEEEEEEEEKEEEEEEVIKTDHVLCDVVSNL
jgi:ribosomal protein L12E/L44/L45/RPP1/RPP2